MKVTKQQLKQVIKEELKNVLKETALSKQKPLPEFNPLAFAQQLCKMVPGGADAIIPVVNQIIDDPKKLIKTAQQWAKALEPALKPFGIPDINTFIKTAEPMLNQSLETFKKLANPFNLPIPVEDLEESAKTMMKAAARAGIEGVCR